MLAEISTADLFVEVCKQIPALAVLVYLVILFLAHLKELSKEHTQAAVTRDQILERALEGLTEALKESATVNGRTSSTLDRWDSWARRAKLEEKT